MYQAGLVFFLVFFTFVSGFLSLAFIAIFSLSTAEVKLYAQDPDPRKRQIHRLLCKPRDLLVTLLFYDITANILIQNTAAKLFGQFASWYLTVGVPLALTLILGEMLPKTLALPFNTRIAHRVVPTIYWLHKLLGPVRRWLTDLTSYLASILFFFLKKDKEISHEELSILLHDSQSYGILSREEAKLVEGYLSLTDVTVKERMRPRHEILYYDLEDALSKLGELYAEKGCSRIPVCQNGLQNLLGILPATNFFLNRHAIQKSQDIIPFLKKPYYVPQTIFARTLLRHFFYRKEELGMVVDEYSSIVGLITQEDLFEIVVGEIRDQRDTKRRYTPAGQNVVIASGKMELIEFEELFDMQLPSENNQVTLGGWLTEQLGEIPKSGTKHLWRGFLFQVLAADPNRVRRVYIRRLKNE
jgi:putative hemolysin